MFFHAATKRRSEKASKGIRRRRQHGFSFAEVMFAVIILGVGFIMVAALFPVAIRQSKSTADETSAAAIARAGAAFLAENALDRIDPANPTDLSARWMPVSG